MVFLGCEFSFVASGVTVIAILRNQILRTLSAYITTGPFAFMFNVPRRTPKGTTFHLYP